MCKNITSKLFALASFHGLNNINCQYLGEPAKVRVNNGFKEAVWKTFMLVATS